ncbi:MAG: hypothetical protein V8T01_06235 [Oscillospiraceae bacterium]
MRQQHGVCCFRGGRPTEIRLADFLRADDEAMLDTAPRICPCRRRAPDRASATGTTRSGRASASGSAAGRSASPSRLPHRRQKRRAQLCRALQIVRAESHYLRRGAVVQSIEQGRQDCRCRRCGGRTFALERMRPDGL